MVQKIRYLYKKYGPFHFFPKFNQLFFFFFLPPPSHTILFLFLIHGNIFYLQSFVWVFLFPLPLSLSLCFMSMNFFWLYMTLINVIMFLKLDFQ